MSTLLAYFFEKDIPVSQKFRLVNGKNIAAIRPHIFKKEASLDGNLVMDLYDGSEKLATSTFSYLDLNDIMGINPTHGFVTWSPTLRLGGRKSGESSHEYELRLTYDGDDAFNLAWVMEYENLIMEMYGSGQTNDAFKPRDIEIWTYA